jgi:hypothetical protein
MPSDNPFELDVRVVVPRTPPAVRGMTDDTGFGTDLSRCRACPETMTCSVVQCPTEWQSPCCIAV